MSFTESVNITIIILGNGLSATIIEAICTPLLNLFWTQIQINNSDGLYAFSEIYCNCVTNILFDVNNFLSFNRDMIHLHFNIIHIYAKR